jgi:hypothetical protein
MRRKLTKFEKEHRKLIVLHYIGLDAKSYFESKGIITEPNYMWVIDRYSFSGRVIAFFMRLIRKIRRT